MGELMNKEKKEKAEEPILSCGCGHCRSHEEHDVEKIEGGFIKEYGFDVLKMAISLALIIVAALIPVEWWVKLIMFIAAALVTGYEILIESVKNIFHGEFLDENMLMIIASVVAFVLGEYLEGALIILLFSVGELLEEVATDNSRKKIAGLKELKVDTVRLLTRVGVKEVSPEDVPIGSLIEIRKGDKVAIDGDMYSGDGEFDLKAVTGESNFYHVEKGGKIYSGGINVGDPCVIKTTSLYKDSTVERIIAMVETSAKQKAKSQKFITSFAKVYTPVVVGLAVLIAVIPPLFDAYNFTKWIYKALSLLVVSCPCALVISVPLSFFIGIGSLAKCGVLIKGSNYLELLPKVKTVLFDKTGTLTKGKFKVEKITAENGFEEDKIISYAVALEKHSNHPLAQSVVDYALNNNLADLSSTDVEEVSGKGVKGNVAGKSVALGNLKFMDSFGVKAECAEEIGSVLYVAVDGVYAGKILLADEIKENAAEAVRMLKAEGVNRMAIISGDNKKTVDSVKAKLLIEEGYGELLPEQKAEKVREIIKQTKGKTAYAGDGINDAPVLAMSDVGFAMAGLGSESAIESADVVIMDDDVRKIPLAIKHSKKIKRIVVENIAGSIAVKFAIMILSVTITLPIYVAMLGDVGVMILAVLNALRNYRIKKLK